MAQTDTRAGFRLPWTPDRTDSDEPVADNVEQTTVTDEATTDEAAHAEEAARPAVIDQTAPPAARRATKLMADFSRAMQVAAEASRDEMMARFSADAKTVVEDIQNGSTAEAATLRRRADDDIAAIREWSKGEIARVREETDGRIAKRKAALDGEIDAYAATIDIRVEQVGVTVNEFETRMATFFERLLAEEDPTRIATMAETMPEPPDLAAVAASIPEPGIASFDPASRGDWVRSMPEATALDHADEPSAAPAVADHAPEDTTETAQAAPAAQVEHDFAAAEAEAAAFAGELDQNDGVAAALAAADEGIPLPNTSDGAARAGQGSTRVTVVGLVSVASIASFKRSLSRVAGVATIAVASGPDGEFVFTVNHEPGLALADAIAALPGFEAQITAQAAGEIEVAAHDPDAGD
jgi:hypothetical protein